MREIAFDIFVEHNDEIAGAWAERIALLRPDLDPHRINSLVQQLMAALNIYLIDADLPTTAQHIHKILRDYFADLDGAPAMAINALLLVRYILLSIMARYSREPLNSLETFGQLNDLFEPLIRELNRSVSLEEMEPLSGDFSRAAKIGLLTIDFAGIALVITDCQFNIIHWNPGMERMCGRSADRVLGHTFFNEFPDLCKKDLLHRAFNRAVSGGHESEMFDVKCRWTSEGEERIFNFKVAPLRNRSGEVIGASLLLQDITERRRSERALHTYEQYFENILNDAADAIIILDSDDRIVMWNDAAEALYGWPRSEAVGQSISLIVPSDPESQKEIERISEQVREKGFLRNFRTQRLTRDGKHVTIEVTRTAIHNEKGRVIGSSVIARDMTQQDQLRQQLVQSEKLSAVGTLAAGFAHEVSTPLSSISSLTQVLMVRSKDPKNAEKLSLIQESIDRISRTIRTLVDFSRPITQKIENVYLNSVIEHVLGIIKYDHRLKYQKIEPELKADLPMVRASFDQLQQVFINICLNAADAMEQKPEGCLRLRTWSEEQRVFASIEDNGRGIAETDIEHIFEPFFTTKEKGQGTGLGLWVSYNIIKGFSGDISVRSQLEQGTLFTITLPAAQGD